jgi:hypothetical protein
LAVLFFDGFAFAFSFKYTNQPYSAEIIKNGASDARAAMKSIPTREGLKPSSKIVKRSADPAKASGGVTAET